MRRQTGVYLLKQAAKESPQKLWRRKTRRRKKEKEVPEGGRSDHSKATNQKKEKIVPRVANGEGLSDPFQKPGREPRRKRAGRPAGS